ncbi:MAG: murein biosynthesis integral membrane protein MurJ [Thermodesulfobacteriota bacterium]
MKTIEATGSEVKRCTRAAGVVGGATLMSRLLGFVRDMVIAGFFGAGMRSDAFFVAFRIPNLMRRLFAEGTLSVAFIPVFTEYLTEKGKPEAIRLACAALRFTAALLVLVVILGMWASPVLVRVFAPGFIDDPIQFEMTVGMTRLMFPYLFFICLTALCMGVLNSLGHFAGPALAPILLNIAIIFAAFFISPNLAEPITGLAWGVLIGGLLQLAFQAPFLVRHGVHLFQRARFFHPALSRIGNTLLPAVLGAAVYQINVLVGTLLASLLPRGSVSYLYYADRLVQFPLGIFAVAMATAVLPSLSRQAAAGDMAGLRDTFAHTLRLVFFITLPAMVGLIVLREPIIGLLFQRGAFDARAVRATADALLFYSLGLPAFSGVRIVASAFYALQDTRTPMKTAVVAIGFNLFLGVMLMGPMGHGGLALATSSASILNLVLLIFSLRWKLGAPEWAKIVNSACKSVICSVIMGGTVWGVAHWTIPWEGGTSTRLVSGLLLCITTGCIFYSGIAFLMKSPEMKIVLAAAGKGVRK